MIVKRSDKAHYQGKEKEESKRKDETGLDFNSSQRAAEDLQRWQKIVADVCSGATTTLIGSGTQR